MTSRIEDFKTAIVAKIIGAMPELKECKAIGGRFNMDVLLTKSVKTPAVQFSVLKSPIDIRASTQISLKAKCAAYVVTSGKEAERDQEAWVIAEAIAVMLANERPWATKISLPEKIEIEPLISADFKKHGITLIAVTWTQSINKLGESLFDDEGVVLTSLYVNDDLVIEPEAE